MYAAARDPRTVTDDGVVPVRLDITDPAQVAAAAQACGDVDLLINNAAYAAGTPLIGAASVEWARAEMETTYFGTLAMCRAFAPVLAAAGGGALVNMLSIVSFLSVPAMGSFCAAKAAAWSMTNGVRQELRGQGTQVVAVHAGFIDTDLGSGFHGPKHDPADIAADVLAAVEDGREELLADARTRAVKRALPEELDRIYGAGGLAAPAPPGGN